MGKINSRNKGKVGENEACKLFHRWWPDCKRMFPRQQQGVPFPDIGCPKMNKHFYVEVKRMEKISDGRLTAFFKKTISAWGEYVDEIYINTENCPMPIVVFREDNDLWYVASRSTPAGGYVLIHSDYGNIMVASWASFSAWVDTQHEPIKIEEV